MRSSVSSASWRAWGCVASFEQSAAIQRASMPPPAASASAAVLQVGGLARGEHDARAGFAERMGHLQAEPARAAGDERGRALLQPRAA